MTTILNGLIGGVIAAFIAELVNRGLRGVSLPTTGTRGSDGGDTAGSPSRESRGPRGAAVRLVAGSLAGGLLVGLELSVLGVLSVPPDPGAALFAGVGWGVALFVVSTVWTGLVSGGRRSPDELVGDFVPYLVFGAALGLWIRLTWIT